MSVAAEHIHSPRDEMMLMVAHQAERAAMDEWNRALDDRLADGKHSLAAYKAAIIETKLAEKRERFAFKSRVDKAVASEPTT